MATQSEQQTGPIETQDAGHLQLLALDCKWILLINNKGMPQCHILLLLLLPGA
jgi:hypothetical protein